jgi:hypothetical protein
MTNPRQTCGGWDNQPNTDSAGDGGYHNFVKGGVASSAVHWVGARKFLSRPARRDHLKAYFVSSVEPLLSLKERALREKLATLNIQLEDAKQGLADAKWTLNIFNDIFEDMDDATLVIDKELEVEDVMQAVIDTMTLLNMCY